MSLFSIGTIPPFWMREIRYRAFILQGNVQNDNIDIICLIKKMLQAVFTLVGPTKIKVQCVNWFYGLI